jgi:molecular chaperone GrpE
VSDEVTNEAAPAPEVLDDDVLAEPVEEDLDELGRVAKERDELKEMAQRLQADFENYRKRAQRQAEDSAGRQAAEVLSALLPVLDTFDLAQAHLSEEGAGSPEGAALVQARALLVDTLTKLGLEPVAGAEEAFDPEVHDAVAHVPAEDGSSTQVVDEVLRAGYAWRGQVLRPAMVRVRG